MKEIIVTPKYNGKKLNTFLLDTFSGLSMNLLYKTLRKKDIRVNDIKVSENGEVYVKFDEKKEIETILAANVITVGTVAQKIEINKKITELSIANYSETANVTVEIGENSYIIGSNMAVDLPIGKDITNISLTSTEEETKVQYVVKGVE